MLIQERIIIKLECGIIALFSSYVVFSIRKTQNQIKKSKQ